MGTLAVNADGGGLGKVAGAGRTPLRILTGTFVFSDSYATGGESLDVTEYFRQMAGLVAESKGGYLIAYNPSTKKLQAYNALSAHKHDLDFVEEEVVTVTANVGTLAANAALIQNVVATAGTSTGPKAMIQAGASPSAGQVAVDLTPATGNTSLTFNATDAITQAKVTYLKASGSVKNNSAAPGSEVAATVNLSTLGSLRWFAWGS